MEQQRTLREEPSWEHHNSWFQTLLQSFNYQNTIVLALKKRQANGTESAAQIHIWSMKEMATHTPVLSPGKFHGLRILVGYSPWGHKESDTTEWLHFQYLSKNQEYNIHWIVSTKIMLEKLDIHMIQNKVIILNEISQTDGHCHITAPSDPLLTPQAGTRVKP